MTCPKCGNKLRCVDTRHPVATLTRRIYFCGSCDKRFHSTESFDKEGVSEDSPVEGDVASQEVMGPDLGVADHPWDDSEYESDPWDDDDFGFDDDEFDDEDLDDEDEDEDDFC